MRSSRLHEPYGVEKSPLFRLRGKNQFEEVLGVKWDSVPELLSSNCYRVWTNKKGREIQQPVHWMDEVHRRLGALLSRIALPDYIFSKKGRSYADNARQHVGPVPAAKTDVSKFYPSVTRAMVFRMFLREFQCAEDVAHRLADICCYQQKAIPTGSALSGRVAFFAAKPMFDEIAKLVRAARCTFTVYVDDITISGDAATKTLISSVRGVIRRHGFKSKDIKSKTFAAGSAKQITGAVATPDGLRLPNTRHKRIWEAKLAIGSAQGDIREKLQRELRGRLQEAAQVLANGQSAGIPQ